MRKISEAMNYSRQNQWKLGNVSLENPTQCPTNIGFFEVMSSIDNLFKGSFKNVTLLIQISCLHLRYASVMGKCGCFFSARQLSFQPATRTVQAFVLRCLLFMCVRTGAYALIFLQAFQATERMFKNPTGFPFKFIFCNRTDVEKS